MILPDTNLLIYAYKKDDPFHDKSARWWSDCLTGSEPVVLCPLTIFGFVRISTNRRIFNYPLSVEEASVHVSAWLEQPIVRFAETEISDIRQALEFLRDAGTAGNLTTDAQIAAMAIRLGATIHTGDTDFARFPLVRWVNPLAAKRGR